MNRPQDNIAMIWQMFEDDGDEHNLAAQSSRVFGEAVHHPRAEEKPELMLQTVVTLGEKTTEGQVIEAVAIAWYKLVDACIQDPQLMFKLDWRKWEEMIAGAYKAEGWEIVTLTPRSNDGGRDVIATRKDFGSIRFIEQVKAYKPGHLVTFEEVMSLVGVLDNERNASKGIVTTTSDFAPGVYTNKMIAGLRPSRLDLRPGAELLKWLGSIPKSRFNKGLLGSAR
jgi:restriction system protein